METIDLLALLFAITFLIYRYFYGMQKFWESQNIRTIKTRAYNGNGSSKYLHEIELKNYRSMGRIYGRYDGRTPVLTVGDPDILKKVMNEEFRSIFPNRRDVRFGDNIMDKMVTALERDEWHRVRKILSETFTISKLKNMLDLLADCFNSLSKNLDEAALQNEAVDINRLLGCYTTDVIARCVFGVKINSHKDPINPFVVNTQKLLSTGATWKSYLAVNFPQVMKFFNISLFNPESTQFFKSFIQELLKHLENNNMQESSFLKLVKETEENFKQTQSKKKLTEDELTAQCCIFFLAGYHATNSTLANAIYSLAVNPDIQENLFKEIKETLPTDEDHEFDIVNNMQYLDSVVLETLRMYPPSVRVERRAAANYTIKRTKESDILVKKGMLISIPIYAMHHDSTWYPEPHKFVPERFDYESRKLRHRYSYIPFGEGPRNCLGKLFALMQIKHTLVHLLRKYQFHICCETKVPLELTGEYGLLKPMDLKLKIQFRKDSNLNETA